MRDPSLGQRRPPGEPDGSAGCEPCSQFLPPHEEQRGKPERVEKIDGDAGSGARGRPPSRSQGRAGSEVDQDYHDYAVAPRGIARGDGILLRRSMDMQDMDPNYCVYWGRKIRAREVAEGWLQMAAGGYLPMAIDGKLLVLRTLVRSPVRGRGQGAEPGPGPFGDYILYQGSRRGSGIELHRSMHMLDLYPEHWVYWGSKVRGRVDGAWLELAAGGFIPMDRLVVPYQSARPKPDWDPVCRKERDRATWTSEDGVSCFRYKAGQRMRLNEEEPQAEPTAPWRKSGLGEEASEQREESHLQGQQLPAAGGGARKPGGGDARTEPQGQRRPSHENQREKPQREESKGGSCDPRCWICLLLYLQLQLVAP